MLIDARTLPARYGPHARFWTNAEAAAADPAYDRGLEILEGVGLIAVSVDGVGVLWSFGAYAPVSVPKGPGAQWVFPCPSVSGGVHAGFRAGSGLPGWDARGSRLPQVAVNCTPVHAAWTLGELRDLDTCTEKAWFLSRRWAGQWWRVADRGPLVAVYERLVPAR
ncbi:hypothetical protein ACFYV5_31275 [Streptomyces sp. NPDC003035]|uniref:hypothetical protein n=1 Tax=Streptomyces sp. NPDC003035 TaxID=3364676 RepID=UPI00369FBEC1